MDLEKFILQPWQVPCGGTCLLILIYGAYGFVEIFIDFAILPIKYSDCQYMLQTPTQVTISISTIIKIALVIFAIWALYLIADIILLLVMSLLLAAAIDPFVDKLQRRGIPRSISMIGICLS